MHVRTTRCGTGLAPLHSWLKPPVRTKIASYTPRVLTEVEQSLVDHVELGEVLDLTGAKQTIRAEVIRDILLGRHTSAPDPRGLRLRGARVTGRLDLRRVRSTVALSLWECDLTAGIDLRFAELPELDLAASWLAHPAAPALDGAGFRTDLLLLDHTKIRANSPQGAVNLAGARIRTQLNCSAAVLHNEIGPALVLTRTRINGTLNLTEATLSGEGADVLHVDGLTYADLPEGVDWLHLLRTATPAHAPQPYRQLATALRAAGQHGQARQALIAQRRDQLDRDSLSGKGERAWARFTGVVLGFGYQPWRALTGVLAAVVLAMVCAAGLGGQGGLARPLGNPPAACSVVDQLGVGLEAVTPLLSTGSHLGCVLTGTPAGQGLAVLFWVLKLLAWGFLALFAAGFTKAVRRT